MSKPRSISVLIPDCGSYTALKVLRCLGQVPEVTTHILTGRRFPLTRFSCYCGPCHYHKDIEGQGYLEVIKRLTERFGIDVVLPATPKGLELISRNREAISKVISIPPVPEYELLRMADDKWSFQCFAREQGFPVIPTVLVAERNKIVADSSELASIEYPALLKPTNQMGGEGILRINSQSDFYRVVEQKGTIKKEGRYILQSHIPGVDYSLGVVCKGGKILTYGLQKDIYGPGNDFGYQKAMEFVHDERVIEIGTRLVEAMKWDGIAFIDFRLDQRDNTMKLLEMNPRFGRALLGYLLAGVNLPLVWCLSGLDLMYKNPMNVSGRYAHPSFYLHLLKLQLLGKPKPVKMSWKETGLRFLVSDPFPELVNTFRGIVKRLHKHNGDNH
jgi:predicted ATP-grasp superfamily ATP-dependent carboligase